jgi:DnaJ-class molecular chaperone
MTIARKQCVRCGGSGTVLRERRKMADGSPDPFDFRLSETCSVCGGAGSVLDRSAAERAVRTGGWLADQIVIERKVDAPIG